MDYKWFYALLLHVTMGTCMYRTA